MGLLQVEGTLDLSQFFPNGTSDGDTAHVVLKRITFEGKLTHVFEGAHVRGRGSKDVIDKNKAITVRFQGIDAPELHFTPSVAKAKAKKPNGDFRQSYGRAAAQALGKYLATLGTGAMKCRVVTEVSKPNDVFDTYGRFIGDIIVTDKSGKDVDINLWMAQKGWAFPTFYTSMSADEIEKFQTAADSAQKKKLGIWKGYKPALTFNCKLLFKDKPKTAPDAGAVSMPKIFRRLALDYVSKGNTKLHTFLATEATPDRCYKTSEFLEQGITVAVQHNLAELVTNTNVTFKPGDLVFQEAASTLYDKKNKKIVGW
jgi:endonuclease YncB( thermonuclease family)